MLSNDEFTKLFPKYSPAEIVVETYDGQRFNEKINNPRGEANVPLSDDELKNKFSSLVKFNTIKDFDSAKLIYSVFNLEKEINNIIDFKR